MGTSLHDTQWTSEAKAAYLARVQELRDALAKHAALVQERTGQDSEMKDYFRSVDRLRLATAAFDDAEFDFCGSVPLGIELWGDEAEGEDDDQGGHVTVLSAVGRWDFAITDVPALIAAGREARAHAYPAERVQEREASVQQPEQAAEEIAHAWGWDALIVAPGLSRFADVMAFIPQSDYQGMEHANPFAIAAPDF